MRNRGIAVVVAHLALLALTPALSMAATQKAGLQFEVDGIGTGPIGKIKSQDNLATSYLFDNGPGPGVMGTISIGLSRHYGIALRSGVFRNERESPFAIPGDSVLTNIRRKLTSVPVLAMATYRTALPMGLGLQLEAGGGIMSHTVKLRVERGPDSFVFAAYQKDPAAIAGLAFSYPVLKGAELVANGDFIQTFARDGDLWKKGDDPKFITVGVGLRFPR